MKTTVTVLGLRELDAKLGLLPEAAGKGVLRRGGRLALKPFDEAWRQNAGPFRDTGQLEESGGVGSKLTRSQRKAQERESTVEVFAGPGPNPQAIQKEFGNVNQAAEPFVRPAWDQTKDAIPGKVGEILWVEIEKSAKRAAKKAAKAAASEG